MMIARTSLRSTSSIASGSARSIAWLIALRFSGRLSAMYAISPSIRTLIGFSAMTVTSVAIEGIAHPRQARNCTIACAAGGIDTVAGGRPLQPVISGKGTDAQRGEPVVAGVWLRFIPHVVV